MCKLEGVFFWEKIFGVDYLLYYLIFFEGIVYIINLIEKYNRDYIVYVYI